MAATVDDVAKRIARLTPNDAGALGEFDDTTFPSAAQVGSVLAATVADLTARFGVLDPAVDGPLLPAFDNVAAWQAAFDVVLSFYAQADQFAVLVETRAAASLASFIAAYERLHPGTDVGAGTPGSGPTVERPPTSVAYEPLPAVPWLW